MNPRFYYAVSQFGAEKVVKAEMANEYPHLKFSFSRPGFVTFKEENDRKAPVLVTSSIFSRLWGQTVGQAKDFDSLVTLLKQIPEGSVIQAFERDQSIPGDEPEGFVPNARIDDLLKKLKEQDLPKFQWNATPKVESMVYDLIWIDDFHVFLGKHFQASGLDPSPGNYPKISLPANAPSRAYLKLAEAIHRFKPHVEKGMAALELGCSPGGATVKMLSLGFKVTGADPRRVDERLLSEKNFKFIQKPALALTELELNEINPNWIVTDMNIAPLEAIDEIASVIRMLRRVHGRNLKLKNGFFTIKLNDWKFVDSIPLYLKRLEETGFQTLIPIQLCSNRQEFFVFAADFAG